MPTIIKENLRFFDKNGSDISPILVDGVWTGSITIPHTSVGLHEVAHVFIAEDVIDTTNIINRIANTVNDSKLVTFTNGTTKNVKPGMWIQGTNIPTTAFVESIKNPTQIFLTEEATATSSTSLTIHSKRYDLTYPRSTDSKIEVRLETTTDEIFYLFDVSYEVDMPVLVKLDKFSFDSANGSSDSLLFGYRQLNPSQIRKEVAQANIASVAKVEGGYFNAIIIDEVDSDGTITRLARFEISFDAEGEDERFKSLLENFGQTISSDEYVAFRDTDIKEERINYKDLNLKRKEMLISFADIWNYLGSYRGLVNALKYFGYGDLRLKEYWLNVAEGSNNEGKFVTMNVPLSLNYTEKEFKDYKTFIKDLVPRFNGNGSSTSTAFKKTSKFALFYDLNRDSGSFDEDGLPITEDVFEFTNEEILIKLFSLKNILKEKFLPLNARIIDITGEGVYYDNIGLNSWNIPTPTIHVDVDKELDFTAFPISGFLEDLTETVTSSCNLMASAYVSDYAFDSTVDYTHCYITDDVDENGKRIVDKHPRYSNKSGLVVTIKNFTNDYTWGELGTSWDDASEKTWDDFKNMDFQTMRWTVRSVNRNLIIYDKKGDIGTLDEIQVTLPYLGFYDVTFELVDHFNFPHRRTKRNYLQVRPKEADMMAVFRKHDDFNTWEEIADSEGDLALGDMHGNWLDVTTNEETTWLEASDITWESLDWATYANQSNLFDFMDDNLVNRENEKVSDIIGLEPSKNTIRAKGFNNSLLVNRKQQNAHFMKDRTKTNNVVLDIVGNAAGEALSFKETTNNCVHFETTKKGWIVGNGGKFIYTEDGGSVWNVEPIDTTNNLNFIHFTDDKNGWIIGDGGTVYHYYYVLDTIKKVERVDIGTTVKLTSVHFVNRNVGYIGGVGVLFRTIDGGATWSDVMPSILSSDIITSLYFITEAFGVAVTNNGSILKTINSGNSWTIKTPSDFTQQYEFRSVFYLDSQFGWVVARGADGMNKVLRTINGGETYIERPFVIEAKSIKFVSSMIGYICGFNNTILKTFDGGNTWVITYYRAGPLLPNVPVLNSIFPASGDIVYAVGTDGSILKTTVGGFIFNSPPPQDILLNWFSQKQNQQDYVPSGIGADVWITEPYSGTVLKNERAVIAIKHTPSLLTWTGSNTLKTTWPLGSTQCAINATQIYFNTPIGKQQYSIKNSYLTITNEVEYVLDQAISDTSSLTNAFVLQNYSAIVLDSKPKYDSTGLRITWRNIWTNNRDSVLSNMVIVLKLESKDFNCDVLNMEFEGDETILYMNPSCDVIPYLDSDYSVILKEYNINEAISSAGSINRNWETFCKDLTWNDMSEKTWNDFEYNGVSYCSYVINKVSRGGTILVNDKHLFQFDPEDSIQIEGELTLGDSYVNLDSLIELHVDLVGNPKENYAYGDEYWGIRSSGDGFNFDIGFAVKLVYLGKAKNNRDHLFRILGTYSTTGVGDEIELVGSVNIAQILDIMGAVLTTDNFGKPSLNLINQSPVQSISYPYLEKLEIGMPIHGDGIPVGSYITYIDGINPYNPNRIIISNQATKTGKFLISCILSELTLDDAVILLNNSNVEGIKDFIYSRPLLTDGITQSDYIIGVAKSPGVSALHYFEFLYGVESNWEDDPSHTHSYPLGIFKEWIEDEIDGGQPLGENNPPLWSHIYNTYYELGEWFPAPEKLGDLAEDIESMRVLYSQAIDGTFNWQDTIVKRWKVEITPGTTVFFNSYPSKVVGIKSHNWRVFNQQNSLLFETNNDVLIWTFCDAGLYSIELKVTDLADNSYLVRRDSFVKVKSPKVLDHTLPGLGWVPPNIPPNAPTPLTPILPPQVQPPILSVVPPLMIDTTVGNFPIDTSVPEVIPPYSNEGTAIYIQEFDVANIWELRTSGSNSLLAIQMVLVWRNEGIQQKSLSLNKFYVDYYEITDGFPKSMTKEIEFTLPDLNYNPEGTTSLIELDEENSNSYFNVKDKIERHYIKPTNNSL